jgi:predicted ATPase/tetratricopeptide (TPR) repeat protein/DNA-binding XRE family transcriptional regulator
MNKDQPFGVWLRGRRRALDLTQEELARQVGCSAITLRKLEAEERRPSKQIAERLADVLKVAPDERAGFLRFARGDPFAAPADARAAGRAEQPRGPRHNLPLQLTSFIGREKEMAEVERLISTARLVTLTGPGGAGKTRLALQVAAGVVDNFPEGVWLVELAALADPALVPQTVAAVLGLREVPGRGITETLLDYLRSKRLLLVLDNCEHLVQACAELAETLLRACPQLTILTTSREALAIAGESTYPVPALSLPDPEQIRSMGVLTQSEAVQLFVERATAVMPKFALTSENVLAVAEICRQLDGMPLAIELASARVKVMRVEQIAARLNDRFRLLTAGSRTALPRHQTLQALIDWSYDLLSAPEQLLLRRLAVFMGGCRLEMAEAVCAGIGVASDDVFDLMTQLVNKSLVVAQPEQGSETRYRMLETIRQYALARLNASGEADGVWRRAATYLIDLEQTFRPIDHLPSEAARLVTELGNLRAALTWSQSATGSTELGMWLALVMFNVPRSSGNMYEIRSWLEAALARADAEGYEYPRARARVLGALGQVVASQGDFAAGSTFMTRSIRLHQQLGERLICAYLLGRLGVFARQHGDAAAARVRMEESLAIFRELEDQAGIADVSLSLAEVASMQGDTEGATSLVEKALPYFRAHDNPEGVGWALNHLGHVAQIRGDYERARWLHEESLEWFEEGGGENPEAFEALGETALAQGEPTLAITYFGKSLKLSREQGARLYTAWCLAGLAGVAALDEDPERAAQLWSAAEALRQSIGGRAAPASHAMHERLMAAAREQMGQPAFDAAWAEGQAMTTEQAIELALEAE